MRPILSKLFLLSMVVAVFGFDSSDVAETWTPLFNGKNLDGWTVKVSGQELGVNLGNVFRVENGILSVRYDQEPYKNFNSQFGALYTNKQYKNYRLRVEYRFVGETAVGAPAWGFRDSGIQYHAQSARSMGLKQNFPVCLEYNLHGGNGKDERPVGEICASGTTVEINGQKSTSFCTPATVKRTFHGDQWVTLEIDVKDNVIRHFVNNEEILKFENPRYNPTHELGKQFIVGGEDRVKAGYISLQSNSHPIDFRRIEIVEY